MDPIKNIIGKYSRTVTSAPSHCQLYEGAQTRLCAKTSSTTSNPAVTVGNTVNTVFYTLGTDKNGLFEHPSAKKNTSADKDNSKDEILEK